MHAPQLRRVFHPVPNDEVDGNPTRASRSVGLCRCAARHPSGTLCRRQSQGSMAERNIQVGGAGVGFTAGVALTEPAVASPLRDRLHCRIWRCCRRLRSNHCQDRCPATAEPFSPAFVRTGGESEKQRRGAREIARTLRHHQTELSGEDARHKVIGRARAKAAGGGRDVDRRILTRIGVVHEGSASRSGRIRERDAGEGPGYGNGERRRRRKCHEQRQPRECTHLPSENNMKHRTRSRKSGLI